MLSEATRILAWSVKVPAAEDEDESASPVTPKHAALSATTKIRFMLRATEHAVGGESRQPDGSLLGASYSPRRCPTTDEHPARKGFHSVEGCTWTRSSHKMVVRGHCGSGGRQ